MAAGWSFVVEVLGIDQGDSLFRAVLVLDDETCVLYSGLHGVRDPDEEECQFGGFSLQGEGDLIGKVLRTRFAKFSLKRYPEKTRLIEFGRFAIERRKARGEGRPETFVFRGFTHVCEKTRSHGWFTIKRYTIATIMNPTLQAGMITVFLAIVMWGSDSSALSFAQLQKNDAVPRLQLF